MPSIKYNLKSIIGSVNSIVLSSAGNKGSEARINKLSEMSGAAHVGALVTCLAFTGLMGTLTTVGIKQDFEILTDNAIDFTKEAQSKKLSFDNLDGHLGAESVLLNQRLGDPMLKFVSQRDRNLKKIVSSTDDKAAPDYGQPSFSEDGYGKYLVYNLYQSLYPDMDTRKLYGYTMMMNDKLMGQHALSIYENEDDKSGRKICYIKEYGNSEFKGRDSAPIFFSEVEGRVVIKHHEQAHCLDRDENIVKDNEDTDYSEETLQGEILADIHAGLMSIKLTGNKDTLRYTLLPFRTIPSHDHSHQSTVALKSLIEMDLDIERINSGTEKEVFRYAQEIAHETLGFKKMEDDRENWFEAEEIFSELTDYLPDFDFLRNNESVQQRQEIAINYGLEVYQSMLNNYVYHDKMLNKNAVYALVNFAKKVANLQGSEQALKTIEAMKEKMESDVAPSASDFAKLLNVEITADPEIFQKNSVAFSSYEDEILEDIAKINKQISLEQPHLAFSKNTSFNPYVLLEKYTKSERSQGIER